MKKTFFIFLFLFFSLSKLSAISVYPGEISFEVYPNQVECKNITFVTGGEMVIQDRWSKKNVFTKEINKHSLKKESLGLSLEYSKNIFVSEKEKTEICFSGKEYGSYHGVLLVRERDSNEGVGIWINATILKDSKIKDGFSITGFSIFEKNGEIDIQKCIFISSFLLLIFLTLLLFLLKRKNYLSKTKTSLPTI
jgi:hypothetical protein